MICSKTIGKDLIQLLFALSSVTVRTLKTLRCGEDCPLPVALNRSPFKSEIPFVSIRIGKDYQSIPQTKIHKIVLIRSKLQPPSIETEIERTATFATLYGYRSVITGPGVVIFTFDKRNPPEIQSFQHIFAILLSRGKHNTMRARLRQSSDESAVLLLRFFKNIVPIGMRCRKGEQYASAFLPFCNHSYIFH